MRRHPTFGSMLIVQLWLSSLFGSYQGAMPAISAALIEFTGDKAAPGLWMTVAAACVPCHAMVWGSTAMSRIIPRFPRTATAFGSRSW